MSEEWLERQEGPDGQWCDLLKRVPYDRQRLIEMAMDRSRSVRDQQDSALRGMLWACQVRDVLTGDTTDDIDKASGEVVVPWRERAIVLANEWWKAAMPGPKGSSGTASRTRRGKTATSETSAKT